MFPNATRGYMPFVSDRKISAKNQKHRSGKENRRPGAIKAYKVTLKDAQGNIYTYIIQADQTKSLPSLCCSKLNPELPLVLEKPSHSLPDIHSQALAKIAESRNNVSSELKFDLTDADKSEKKHGLFASILRFLSIKTKTKSKRKPNPLPHRKRQRYSSNISNLDPIQESPDEDEDDYEDDNDNDSYTRDVNNINTLVSDLKTSAAAVES